MRWEIEDTPEQAEFRSEFRAWLRDELPASWMDAVDAGDDDTLERLKAESGFNPFTWQGTIGRSPYAAPLWPEEYGGLSGEVWMQTVIRSELVRYRLPTVSINLLGVGLAGPTLIAHGTEAQKERYLRKILSAEEIWCQLFSEPGSGSDLASLSTRAVRDGDEWVVNGQKVWTTIAQFAKFGMLLARSDPDVPKHEGLTYFILDMKSPGVEVRPLKQMTGSSEFNEVFLSDVRIPDANRVGDVGDGWRCARTTLMNERVALAGVSLDPVSFTGGVRRDPWQSYLDGIPDRTDPRVRQKPGPVLHRVRGQGDHGLPRQLGAPARPTTRPRGVGQQGLQRRVQPAALELRRERQRRGRHGLARPATPGPRPGPRRSCGPGPTPSRVGRRRSCATRWRSGSWASPVTSRSDKDVAWADVKRS